MADNISVKDAAGATQTIRMPEVAGIKVPVAMLVDSSGSQQINEQTKAASLPVALPSDQPLRGRGMLVLSNNFTRPADTTAYAVFDTVANSTTAGSVNALSYTAARYAGGSGFITGARIAKTTASIVNAQFRLHIFDAAPTLANGDNGAFSTTMSGYIGSIDVTCTQAFSDPAAFGRASGSNPPIMFDKLTGQTLYVIVQALAAYTPGNAEVFTVSLEIEQS